MWPSLSSRDWCKADSMALTVVVWLVGPIGGQLYFLYWPPLCAQLSSAVRAHQSFHLQWGDGCLVSRAHLLTPSPLQVFCRLGRIRVFLVFLTVTLPPACVPAWSTHLNSDDSSHTKCTSGVDNKKWGGGGGGFNVGWGWALGHWTESLGSSRLDSFELACLLHRKCWKALAIVSVRAPLSVDLETAAGPSVQMPKWSSIQLEQRCRISPQTPP